MNWALIVPMSAFWQEFLHLMSNPAHWAFEAVTDSVFTLGLLVVGRIPFRRWVKRHDQEKHGA